jgi:hypothetical protein
LSAQRERAKVIRLKSRMTAQRRRNPSMTWARSICALRRIARNSSELSL